MSNDHYFSTDPASAAQRRTIDVVLAGQQASVHTAAGTFSPDGVDKGTRVLLREVPDPPPAGTLLDLGCGWGPIALTMARLSPGATVYALDVNRRALDLVADNARSLDLPGIRPVTAAEVPDDVRFDAIWSNPPIRVGKAVLHELLRTWLPRLAPGGVAYLVVQKNLGSDSLRTWLAADLEGSHPAEFTVDRFANDKGFRVLSVTRH